MVNSLKRDLLLAVQTHYYREGIKMGMSNFQASLDASEKVKGWARKTVQDIRQGLANLRGEENA